MTLIVLTILNFVLPAYSDTFSSLFLKIRSSLKSWTKLWCALKPGVLLIYKTPKSDHWVGTILLNACKLIERPSKKDGFCFKLYHPLDKSIWAVKVWYICRSTVIIKRPVKPVNWRPEWTLFNSAHKCPLVAIIEQYIYAIIISIFFTFSSSLIFYLTLVLNLLMIFLYQWFYCAPGPSEGHFFQMIQYD